MRRLTSSSKFEVRNPKLIRASSRRLLQTAAATLATLLAVVSAAHAQNTPHIGYVYPAGGRQGATFHVVVGGQYLGSVSNAFISGDGAPAKVVEYNRPLNQKEFSELRDRWKMLQDKRQASRKSPNPTNAWTAADEQEIAEIRAKILKNPPNRQGNPAIAETVTLQVRLSTNAAPGAREIRLAAPQGLSNPLVFCVGQLPEVSEPRVEDHQRGHRELSGAARQTARAGKIRIARHVAGRRERPDHARRDGPLPVPGAQGTTTGGRRQRARIDSVSARCRARLVSGHAGALRRQGQGTGLRRRLPLQPRPGARLRHRPKTANT